MTKAEKALKLAEEITILRNELKSKENEFFLMIDGNHHTPEAGAESPTPDNKTSVANRMRHIIEASAGRIVTVNELIKQLPEANDRTIRATASRLAKSEGIKKTGRGQYRFVGVS